LIDLSCPLATFATVAGMAPEATASSSSRFEGGDVESGACVNVMNQAAASKCRPALGPQTGTV
jgi:hypothetical protein